MRHTLLLSCAVIAWLPSPSEQFLMAARPGAAALPLAARPRCAAAPTCREPASPPLGWRRQLQQRWRSALAAVALGGASAMVGTPPAFAAAPAPKTSSSTTQKKKKTGTKKKIRKSSSGNTALGTMGMIGGVTYWAYASAKAEDEEEQKRIKKETENMDKLAKEFTDIDEQVTVDEDLMASLKKRMGNSTDAEGGGGGGGGDDSPPPEPPVMDSGGGAAVLEPPSDAPSASAPEEPPAMANDDDIARLNKMFGMGDGSA